MQNIYHGLEAAAALLCCSAVQVSTDSFSLFFS